MINKLIKKISESKKRGTFYRNLFSKNDLVFDIGANHGNRTSIFLQLEGKVVSIEPNPKLAKKLSKKYPKTKVVQKAIGSKIGKIDLYINESDVLSTTSKEWMSKISESNRFGEVANQFNKKVEVELTTLEVLFQEYGIPKFIKIDTEGLELEIIKTLKDSQVYCLSFEFAIPETNEDMILAIEHLDSIGYKNFNLSVAESMEFITNKKMSTEKIITLLKNMPEMTWGDIYAFNK
jgi:FkbM family methyltransferase